MGSSSDQHYCLRWNNHQVNLLTVFEELLENEAFTDVTLVPEDGPPFIRCHKMVLAACSTYFQTLFVHLPSNDQHPVIVLKDVKYTEIKAILDYMYRGEVNVAQDQLPALLKVAEVLKVKGLVEEKRSGRRREEVETSLSPPPAISTSTNSSGVPNSEGGNGQASPPSSTSSPYYNYNKSPRGHGSSSHRMSAPIWNMSALAQQQQQQQQQQQLQQHQHQQSHHQIIAKSAPIFPGYENNELRMRKSIGGSLGVTRTDRDTPILRTVLGQGHADSSQGSGLLQPDSHEVYRSPSNGSANDATDGRRSSMDHSHGQNGSSPHTSEHSMMEEDERRYSPRNGPENSGERKAEWKRYKQYTRQNINDAILAVRNGMSALKAAALYGVPSRTLYDKVKKLGITTPRPFRRSARESTASFPYGIGGNVNGRIYDPMVNIETENTAGVNENQNMISEPPYQPVREDSTEREAIMDISSVSPNPVLHQPPEQVDDEVEDLSVNRKNDVRVIVTPTTVIKDEIIDNVDNFNRH